MVFARMSRDVVGLEAARRLVFAVTPGNGYRKLTDYRTGCGRFMKTGRKGRGEVVWLWL